jgi:3-oxoacyl-[acyl-carrier-protein] synthase III
MVTALPPRFVTVEELRTHSPAEALRGFGFPGAWVDGDVPILAATAARRVIDGLAPEIGVLLWTSALAGGHEYPSASGPGKHGVLDRFRYPGSWLQEELGLDQATVSGVAQQGCAGIFSAMRQARALLVAEPEISNVLCVGADALPTGAERELLYNVISDAGCACVLSRDDLLYRWIGYHQVSRGYYWDVPARQSEIIASYFPTAALTIRGVLEKTGVRPDEIDLVIPTGVNRGSWPILMRLCGIPEGRLYQPEKSYGHTIAADSMLMLEEARQRGTLRPGMTLLLFAYGFGASWCALILETTDRI